MKNLIIILTVIFGLTSCGNTYFEESQPRGMKLRNKIPKSLIGKYKNPEEKGWLNIDQKFVISYDENGEVEDTLLSVNDSCWVTKHKDYYYFNIKGSEKLWIVIPMKIEGDSLKYWLETKLDDSFLNRSYVRKEKEINKTYSSSREVYFINPSRKELLELHKEGVFKDEVRLIKID